MPPILQAGMEMCTGITAMETGRAMGDTMAGNRCPIPIITPSIPNTKPPNKETTDSKPSKITATLTEAEIIQVLPFLVHRRCQEVEETSGKEEVEGIGVGAEACMEAACEVVEAMEEDKKATPSTSEGK